MSHRVLQFRFNINLIQSMHWISLDQDGSSLEVHEIREQFLDVASPQTQLVMVRQRRQAKGGVIKRGIEAVGRKLPGNPGFKTFKTSVKNQFSKLKHSRCELSI